MELEKTEIGRGMEKVEEGLYHILEYVMGTIETGNQEILKRIEKLEKRVEKLEEK
ncbi:MAG: hypothetical protein ABEJ99_03175 [Candidatus Nanohaloarchaea archaeon]